MKLEIWAAIDLRRGHVVSLRKGNPVDSFKWHDDPLTIAARWENEGATGLHIVDLDAALGEGSNRKVIESVSRNSRIPVQVGGGIRTTAQAEELLGLGITRVILGTVVYNQPSFLSNALRTLGSEHIVVAVDYRSGLIVTHGWTKESSLNVLEAIRAHEANAVKTVLTTAVELDGTALGPDLGMLRKIRTSTGMEVLASGGVRDLNDIRDLEAIGVDGAIAGRALYEETLHLREISQRA